MRDARFANGRPQRLYFPNGQFKGMEVLLRERKLWPAKGLRAECKNFQCPDPDAALPKCCARRRLFNQADFKDQKSRLQEFIESKGHYFLFDPKFHCETNFIEMCWGRAKYAYRMYNIPRDEKEQEKNIRKALDSVPVLSMQR